MTLFDYYLQYMQELFEGRRQPPEGMTLTATDEAERMKELSAQLAEMGVAAFVRACAEQDGTVLPEEIFAQDVDFPQAPEDAPADDPDAGKHAFEVFSDCIALDDDLVKYLIEVLKNRDWKEFYKLSQITTKLDLDPHEFLYWLSHRENYGTEEERLCVAVMDRCLARLKAEGKTDIAAALLSGDRKTFEIFRCEAPELVNLPCATYEWFSRNYLDRDYPLRTILKWNGVAFSDKE